MTTKNLYVPTLFRPQSSLLRLLASSFVWLWGIKRLIRHRVVTLFVSCPPTYPRFSLNEINDVTTKKTYMSPYISPPVVALVSAGVVVRLVVGYQTPNSSHVRHSYTLLFVTLRDKYCDHEKHIIPEQDAQEKPSLRSFR